jgi:hypothetical protein
MAAAPGLAPPADELTAEIGLMNKADEAKPLVCSPKLPDRESRLASVLDPLAEVAICSGGSLFA